MNYIKAKYSNSGRSYTFKTDGDVKPGDIVVNDKGTKLTVIDEPVDAGWILAYGTDKVAVVKKYEEPADNTLKIGDRVIMNDKYYVNEKNKGKVFTVRTNPQKVGGTLVVWLEDFSGCYAVDGLTKYEPAVAGESEG